MAITLFGGGVGGWTPTPHSEPVDTLAHWLFQGNRNDSVGTYNLDQGNFGFAPIGSTDTLCFATNGNNYDNTGSTALSPNENVDFKYTFATCLHIPADSKGIPVGNADIVRYEQTAGGGTHFRVGMVEANGTLFMGRDTSAGYQQDVTAANIDGHRGSWIHFAFTQAADGLSGAFYINGALLETWSTANAPNATSGTAKFIIGSAWNNALFASYYSTIVREKECSAAEVLAMAQQVGLG